MQGSNNREWLIKSAGEIKGPYTFEEIVQGISSKEFILVDEISRKFCRWKYLRDEDAFEKAILEHKNREYSKSEKTFTNSGTDTLTEEITNDVVRFNVKDGLLSNVQEHLKENENARVESLKTEARAPRVEESKNYAMEADLRRQAEQQGSSFKILLLLIVAGIIGGYFYLNKKDKQLSYDDIKKIAFDNLNQGNYPQAKIYLEKALVVNNTNEEIKYLLSYVSIDTEDTITAQRLLGELSQSVQDKKIKSQVYNLLGVLHLKNFNLEEAKKTLGLALTENPKSAPVFFNKGVSLYLENKYEEAHENFTQSLVNGGLDGSILLAMTELYSRQASELTRDQNRRKQVGDVLNLLARQSSSLYAYRQEMKVAMAYLYHLVGESDMMKRQVMEALNIDPTLTTDHVPDVQYYKGLVTWDRLSDWIKKMKDANPSNEDLKTLYGYALFKGSEKLKGKDLIEGLLKSNYSNTFNQIIHAYILMALKRDDDAKATLSPIMHHKDKNLSFVLMGKICLLKKDYPCVESNFTEARKIEDSNITALAGLAEASYVNQDYKMAQEYARQAFKFSSTYKPTLVVRQKLEAKKGK